MPVERYPYRSDIRAFHTDYQQGHLGEQRRERQTKVLPLKRLSRPGIVTSNNVSKCDAEHCANRGGPTQWVWEVCAGPNRSLLAWDAADEWLPLIYCLRTADWARTVGVPPTEALPLAMA